MKYVRYILVWPTFIGWLFPLLAVALFFAKDLRFSSDATLVATWRDWWTKHFKYSSTLGRGIILRDYGPGWMTGEERIWQHELVHVRQFEDYSLLALTVSLSVAAITQNPWWILMWSTGMLWMIPNFWGAVLRGGNIYRDSEHEKAAYAQNDLVLSGHVGKTWASIYEENRSKK